MPINPLGQPIGDPLTTTLPRPRPPRTPMMGRTVSLVPADPARHAKGLFDAYAADPDNRIWTYMSYGPFADPDSFRGWMDATCSADDPLFYTILDPSGIPVGLVAFLRIDPAAGVIEVGYVTYAPCLQRTVTATEAMALMMTRVFDDLGYRRYEWKCDALNGPSRQAAERLGFTYEGTFRQATHYKGRNRDTAWFSIIDTEWPAIKAGMQRWLDRANFDADGRQRRRLTFGT